MVLGFGHSGQVSPIESSTSRISATFVRSDAGRRTTAGDIESAFARMWVGAVLHPAVLLAFADGAGFVQNADRPAERTRPTMFPR